MKEQRFFICKHCGNLIGMINDAGAPITCCGEKMTELIANTTDASQEKHVPAVKTGKGEVTVTVGFVPHPATEEHHIGWLYLATSAGGHRINLNHTAPASATFHIAPTEKPLEVFAYCNLHGLWKAKV